VRCCCYLLLPVVECRECLKEILALLRSMSSTIEQIREYEGQLAEVQGLLDLSPEDTSLLSLKSDLVELIAVTKQTLQTEALALKRAADDTKTSASVFDRAMEAALGQSVGRDEPEPSDTAIPTASFADIVQEAADEVPLTIDTSDDQPKKKSKAVKAEFEVPQHLICLDTDTTAERNKKQRALKALKSKWRESKKEAESNSKQKSWQTFQKKKKIKTDSIFKTGDDSAVGVVSAGGKRQLTEFGERKRHKHDDA
jgi:survival of motor neuron-related-splicing factor 30